ncbi:hypothetical protein BLS_007894 [Venturia inaequalis]|uniref:SET domain-containing protein n=1 Tax=Venturia inaequalis TaxID=5025 RepID=A0A8H3YNZ6_VENIN|nr:hypothetical protein BLS_007894 [Venturia inaequalis]KAE9990796.1 hypothetical protein EG327_000943 [Venturia inaequalis]
MDGNWEFPVTSTVDDSFTKGLFARITARFSYFNAKGSDELILEVQRWTAGILQRPYSPKRWMLRAGALMRLGYPDLAAGDAYKATILFGRPSATFNSIHSRLNREGVPRGCTRKATFDQRVDELRCDVTQTLATCLFFCNSFQECLDVLLQDTREECRYVLTLRAAAEDGLEKERQDHAAEGLDEAAIAKKLLSGTVTSRTYPWMREELAIRNHKKMASLKKEMEHTSRGQCIIKRSQTVSPPSAQDMKNGKLDDAWGAFANQDIDAESTILRDSTAYVSCSKICRCSNCGDESCWAGFKMSCCSRAFCSVECKEAVLGHNHDRFQCLGPPTPLNLKQDCLGYTIKSTEEIEELHHQTISCKKTKVQNDLLHKVLNTAYQSQIYNIDERHPLECYALKTLTAARGSEEVVEFSLEHNIKAPIDMLVESGVDIFTNADLDTWVIQTIQSRLSANTWERELDGMEYLGLSFLYAIFNHCCEPNVYWDFAEDRTTIILKALRPIKAGEELFISYIKLEDLDLGRLERQKNLSRWFPKCMCHKCAQEEEKEKKKRSFPSLKTPRVKGTPELHEDTDMQDFVVPDNDVEDPDFEATDDASDASSNYNNGDDSDYDGVEYDTAKGIRPTRKRARITPQKATPMKVLATPKRATPKRTPQMNRYQWELKQEPTIKTEPIDWD